MLYPEILPFTGGGVFPVQYEVDYQGHSYYIRYRHGWLSVTRDFVKPEEVEVYEQQLTQRTYHGEWSDEETTVYLTLISQAIRDDDFITLCLPGIEETPQHPFYRKGPLPVHCVGLICGKKQAPIPAGSNQNRHWRRKRREAGLHDHDLHCYACVPAQEVEEWIRNHLEEHHALHIHRRR